MGLVVGPRLSAAGGVAITGIDLAKPLPAQPKARISEAFRDHHVVVFPGQALTREEQYEYARNCGFPMMIIAPPVTPQHSQTSNAEHRPACLSTRSDWRSPWSLRPCRSGSPTHRCFGRAVLLSV